MNIDDCIFPDCQIKTDYGPACEHSCPHEKQQKENRAAMTMCEHQSDGCYGLRGRSPTIQLHEVVRR